jgi:hypothetical protein
MVKSKFKVGDAVYVVRLDKEMADEQYDKLGDDYKESLYEVGAITEIDLARENPYTVEFPQLQKHYDTWYFSDKEIIHYDPNVNRKTLELLYGKKEV